MQWQNHSTTCGQDDELLCTTSAAVSLEMIMQTYSKYSTDKDLEDRGALCMGSVGSWLVLTVPPNKSPSVPTQATFIVAFSQQTHAKHSIASAGRPWASYVSLWHNLFIDVIPA